MNNIDKSQHQDFVNEIEKTFHKKVSQTVRTKEGLVSTLNKNGFEVDLITNKKCHLVYHRKKRVNIAARKRG